MTKKQLLSAIICLILTVALFSGAQAFLAQKGSYGKNADFYAYEDDFEVLFFGTSLMTMAVAPMELWHDFGITSYNMANYGQHLPVDYWVLKNALDYQKPKLAVFETYMLDSDELVYEMFSAQLHEAFDTMPLTKNKYDAVTELFPEEMRMEYLFPFTRYHTRWSVIDRSFFERKKRGTEKGAFLDGANTIDYARVAPQDKPDWTDRIVPAAETSNGKTYLRKSIELCRENGIDVLLVAFPFWQNDEDQAKFNGVATDAQAIADEYGIRFFNMVRETDFTDYATDLSDIEHLNSSGMRKATRVMGEYLRTHYDLDDLRGSSVADAWNRDYEDYTAFKLDWLKDQTALESYLMLLSGEPYDVFVTAYDETVLEEDLNRALIENLDSCQVIKEAPQEDGTLLAITVLHRETGGTVDTVRLNSERKLVR